MSDQLAGEVSRTHVMLAIAWTAVWTTATAYLGKASDAIPWLEQQTVYSGETVFALLLVAGSLVIFTSMVINPSLIPLRGVIVDER